MDIYSNGNIAQYKQEGKQKIVNEVKKSTIYIYFAIALALTGLVAFSTPYAYEYALNNSERLFNFLITTASVSSIVVLLPISIYMAISSSRNREGKSPVLMGVMFTLYAIFMGLIIGTILFAILKTEGSNAIRLVSYAFLITAGVFLICGIIGSLAKDLSPALSIVGSLIIGSLVLTLLNIFLKSNVISWIISFAFLLFILVITAYDFHIINKIAGKSTFGNPNITAMYCAFTIYTDFVILFIRILYILLIFFGNSKK